MQELSKCSTQLHSVWNVCPSSSCHKHCGREPRGPWSALTGRVWPRHQCRVTRVDALEVIHSFMCRLLNARPGQLTFHAWQIRTQIEQNGGRLQGMCILMSNRSSVSVLFEVKYWTICEGDVWIINHRSSLRGRTWDLSLLLMGSLHKRQNDDEF